MIEDILPRKIVIADGVLSEVAFDFEVVNADYIKVYLNGVIQNSGWSLSDNKIIFTSAPSVNTTITVIRDLPVNYISPIKSRGALTSDKIDEHLSEMTAKVQTLSERISRVPTYPVDTLLTGEQITEDFLEKFQKSSDNLASISEAKDEVVTAKVDGIKALNDETARLTAQVANVIDDKVDMAENAATSAETFAETSKQWAIKMDDKVANEDYSAKYYANQARISASLTKLDDKLTNLLIKIPQDIKLELNDGTLTLKAGSKVYVPNGVGVFDEVVIPSDVSRDVVWTGPGIITCENNNYIDWAPIDYCFSGDAAPDNPINGSLWYDTGNNRIWRYDGSKWTAKKSLPIAILNSSKTQSEQSIKQVFNGFGYIGSTNFALPGVKGLIPDGRNVDGSLNNIEFTTTSVLTFTVTSSNIPIISVDSNNIIAWGSLTYDAINNINKTGDGVIRSTCLCGYLEADSNGRIISFDTKLPVRLADDQEVVHKEGNEAINGYKTFTNGFGILKSSGSFQDLKNSVADITQKTTVTDNTTEIRMHDKNDKVMAIFEHQQDNNGDLRTLMAVRNHANTAWGDITIGFNNNDTIYTKAPTPPAGNNSTQIATTNWCYDPAKSTNLVHRSGSETIAGTKTFLPDSRTIYLKDDETILANNPSVDRYPCRFIWLDKNNIQLGYMQIYEYTNGNRNVGIGIRNKQNTTFHALSVWVEPNGTAYVTVPSPSSSDNSTKVPTTAWVRNYVKTGGAQLDYTKGVTITGNGTKTTSFAGALMINASNLDNWGSEQVTLTIDGQTFYYGNGTVNLDNPHIGQIYFPMKSGQSYNISSPKWDRISVRFFPYV